MATRLMAKTFSVESTDKGSPLQSKINAFTNGKNIVAVHDLKVVRQNGVIRAGLLYELAEGEASKEDRIYAKVVEAPFDSEFQTKVNSFSKDKDLEIVRATLDHSADDDRAVAVILHHKRGDTAASASGDSSDDNGGDDSSDE